MSASISERKTVTNWGVFEKANLVPTRITCNGYLGSHPSDQSCHSNILTTADSVMHHMDPAHGGGWFFFRLRVSDGKKTTLWKELSEKGVEIQDIYCPHCRKQVQLTPRGIIFHLNPHPGANRVNIHPQQVCMTLGTTSPEEEQIGEDLYE